MPLTHLSGIQHHQNISPKMRDRGETDLFGESGVMLEYFFKVTLLVVGMATGLITGNLLSPASTLSDEGRGTAVDCRKNRVIEYHSKIGAGLDLLLTLRNREDFPQDIKHILIRNTVSVSVNFTHELNASEMQPIEALGVTFKRLPNGEIAHTGTVYGAAVPWDRVGDLAELENVVRIESTWKPKVERPITQGVNE